MSREAESLALGSDLPKAINVDLKGKAQTEKLGPGEYGDNNISRETDAGITSELAVGKMLLAKGRLLRLQPGPWKREVILVHVTAD